MKKNKHFLFIQSLRGYAVLFVFLYHLNLDLFLNGFLGLDILYFRDKIHLSQEGSVYLTNFFDNWLIKNKIFIHEK